MSANKAEGFGHKKAVAAAAFVGTFAMLGAYNAGRTQHDPVPLQAAQAQVVALTGADLEKAFWICDYTATEKGVNATPIDICSKVTEDLKDEKFRGDFEALTNWWRENKLAAHQGLRERERLVQPASGRVL